MGLAGGMLGPCPEVAKAVPFRFRKGPRAPGQPDHGIELVRRSVFPWSGAHGAALDGTVVAGPGPEVDALLDCFGSWC